MISELDKHYPFCGPCAMCGGPDKRHRLWDVILDSPEGDEELAEELGLTVEHVRDVRRIYRRER